MTEQPARTLTPQQQQRRKAIALRARAAAAAAGKDWKTLSQDERKTFRQQARLEMRGARQAAKAAQRSR